MGPLDPGDQDVSGQSRGGSGDGWDAGRYARHARFVAELAGPVLALLAPKPGERILDLGCGDGALTAELAQRGCHVVGVDADASMVAAARARGLDVRHRDARALDFADEFDAVFSNAALHWMPEAEEVAGRVRRALRPGGRFVGEFGGRGNVAQITDALQAVLRARGVSLSTEAVWYFPTAEAYAELLAAQGFRVERAELVARPTPLPTGIEGWLKTLAFPFLAALPEEERADALAETIARLQPRLRDAEGTWVADYVRLRFAAQRP